MKSQRSFSEAQYLKISQDHLVVTSLLLLTKDQKQASFENLVAEAFSSFPTRFQLEGYPEWPNAHIIGKAWVRCRTDKKWITGAASEGFSLTPLGEQAAIKTLRLLGKADPTDPAKRRGSRQNISSRVVLRIEKSSAYQTFQRSGITSVSDFEFCDLLYSTLGASPDVLDRNLEVVMQEVVAYQRPDLVQFLDDLRNRFSYMLSGKRVRGGLLTQKKEK